MTPANLNLRAIRNGVGHHFGELADYRTGLTKLLEKSDRLTFVVGEGRRRVDDEQELAWNVLLASLGESSKLRRAMIDADHEHVNDITRRALDETHEQLWFVWFDVLDRAGIGRLDATSERLLADLLDAAAEVGLEPTTWLTAARQRMGV